MKTVVNNDQFKFEEFQQISNQVLSDYRIEFKPFIPAPLSSKFNKDNKEHNNNVSDNDLISSPYKSNKINKKRPVAVANLINDSSIASPHIHGLLAQNNNNHQDHALSSAMAIDGAESHLDNQLNNNDENTSSHIDRNLRARFKIGSSQRWLKWNEHRMNKLWLQIKYYVDEIKKEKKNLETIEIPEEFLDPIMQTLMEDPVILPSSQTTMDRCHIMRHLLSQPFDPFTRASLKPDDLISNHNLKQQILKWKNKNITINVIGGSDDKLDLD